MRSRSASILTASFLLLSGCDRARTSDDTGRAADAVTIHDSPAAAARIRAIRARLSAEDARALEETDTRFARTEDGTRLRASVGTLPDRSTAKRASLIFPQSASDAVAIEDEVTHVRATFALRDARPGSTASVDHGRLLFPAAFHGADVVERVTAEGTEDFFVFESRPASEELVYDVDVSGAAGVRFVSGIVELLDASGTPRLRVERPYAIGASGEHVAASLSIAGCSYDTSPAPPWGRAVVAPNASACELHVRWANVTYPAVVDPGWFTTGSMTQARNSHTSTVLATGKVLIFGNNNGELYDPDTETFAATGASAVTTDGNHTATLLMNGKVLVAGGFGNLSAAELYDPVAGTFAATGSMTTGRGGHCAVRLGSGKVLMTGGYNSALLKSAELYDPTTGTFTATTGSMSASRYVHGCTLLPNGKALIMKGATSAGAPPETMLPEIFDPATGKFTTLPDAGEFTFGYLLPDGKALGLVISPAQTFDADAGTWSTVSGAQTGHGLGTTTQTADGNVFAFGGQSDRTADVYDVDAGAFRPLPPLPNDLYLASAAPLPNGDVLVSGGTTVGPATLKTAEVYSPQARTASTACTHDAQCASGFCIDGVCCDSVCDGQCEACDVAGHVGTCTPVVGEPHTPRAACLGEAGTPTNGCIPTCDGANTATCVYPHIACGSSCADGKETDSLCGSDGQCTPEAPHDCDNLACADAKVCKTSCASDADCVPGFSCQSGACTPPPGNTCADDHTAQDPTGAQTPCGIYKCSAGACLTSCKSISDCVAPNICSSSHECTGASPGGGDSGCDTSGGGADATWTLAVLGLLFVRKRKNEKRRTT